jgi:hypothetical protein
MATVLEECTNEEQSFWGKMSQCKIYSKEIFPTYGGKCSLSKAVHNGVEKFTEERSKVVDDVRLAAELAEITVKILVCCGFDALVKRWNKCVSVGGGYVEK